MFVKLLDKFDIDLILNVNEISHLRGIPQAYRTDEDGHVIDVQAIDWEIGMRNGKNFIIVKDQYEQLCQILTQKL